MLIQNYISFGISLESKKFNLDLIKTLIKIIFSSNFGMQISAKNWDYLNLFFKNSREYKFWDFTWIEIILPWSYKNINRDTFFIKFWNAHIGKNLGLIEKIIKIQIPLKIQSNMSFGISLESKKFNLDLIKTLMKILFSSYFGMQISAKNWDYLKK